MKKIVLMTGACLFLLVGCTDKGITEQYIPVTPKQEQQVEQINAEVQVYSLEQNNKGYIVKSSKRDKWVITNASVVYQHPNALIETSNGQLLQGTVVYMDETTNVALIHFRSTPEVEEADLMTDTFKRENHAAVSYKSFNESNEEIQVNEQALGKIIAKATKKAVPYEKRILLRPILEAYPKIVDVQKNKIDDYDKDTFNVDYDYYRAFAEQFFNEYNSFIKNEENALTTLIANDNLRDVFNQWETFGEQYTLSKIEVSAIVYNNFQYAVQFTAQLGDKEQQVSGTVVLTNIEQQTMVTSFVFEEK